MQTRVSAPDGTELVVSTHGDGPTVIFAHGSHGGLDSWSAVTEHLTGYRIVRYTRRNHPPSGNGLSTNDFGVEAGDLLAVIGAVSADGAHVVGASYGATVALHAALQAPERITSLALFEPPLLLSGPHLTPILERFQGLCGETRYKAALELFLREAAQVPPEVLAIGLAIPDDPAAARAAAEDLTAMAADTADVARWSTITAPLLLMQGALTWPPIPEGMDQLAAALPHAQRAIWPDQSHFATAAAPELVAGAIQEFLDRVA